MNHLTRREREVLAHAANGCRDAEVARSLGIARSTAMNHMRAIREKLWVPCRTLAVTRALSEGELTWGEIDEARVSDRGQQ